MTAAFALGSPPQIGAADDTAAGGRASCRASADGCRLVTDLARRGAPGPVDVHSGGGTVRPQESARRRLRPPASAPGQPQRVCQLWGHPAVAPRRVGPGGALSNPPRPGALPAHGPADPPHAQPCPTKGAAAADVVKPCPRRLGTMAT